MNPGSPFGLGIECTMLGIPLSLSSTLSSPDEFLSLGRFITVKVGPKIDLYLHKTYFRFTNGTNKNGLNLVLAIYLSKEILCYSLPPPR